MNKLSLLLLIIITALFGCTPSSEKSVDVYDIVILNARVIDPETNTDSVLNVGIVGDKITAVTAQTLEGKQSIDATGLVLSPGFIDLHAHGQSNVENSFQAYDGVTTSLELEIGVDTLKEWLAARENKAVLNFGAAACQIAIRNKLINKDTRVKHNVYEELSDPAVDTALSSKDFEKMWKHYDKALNDGALGIGIAVGYLPNASVEEIAASYVYATKNNIPIYSHVREGGAIAFQQAIADAVVNGTTLHLCHINSMARKDIAFCLDLVEKAQKNGYPITTELYPYTAGNTDLGSAIFDEGWQERFDCTYKDLQWVETGERLTKESFERYRKTGGSVIVHMMKPSWIDLAVQSPVTMIASDGAEFSAMGHPRSSGTFSKILGEYVRKRQLISLTEAIEKMTLMPAQLLEEVSPNMKLRGRVQEGCYADLCLFDPETIIDKSTYKRGFEKSEGVKYLFVNGKILIDNGKLLPNVFPGKAIKSHQSL